MTTMVKHAEQYDEYFTCIHNEINTMTIIIGNFQTKTFSAINSSMVAHDVTETAKVEDQMQSVARLGDIDLFSYYVLRADVSPFFFSHLFPFF